MIRMTLADYAKIHGQAKAASDFGVIQCAISKAILAGRNIMVTVWGMSLYTASLWTAGSIRTLRQYIFGFT